MDNNTFDTKMVLNRLCSFIVDISIVVFIEIFLFLAFYSRDLVEIFQEIKNLNVELLISLYLLFLTSSLIILIISCLYYPVSIKLFGNTLGRKLFNIKMVRYDGVELSFANIFFREIGKILLLKITFGIDALFYFYKKENLTFHDRLFKTKFISLKRN